MDRFDVIIVDLNTNIVQAVVGTNLPSCADVAHMTHTAESRKELMDGRLADCFSCEIVITNKYKKGDIWQRN